MTENLKAFFAALGWIAGWCLCLAALAIGLSGCKPETKPVPPATVVITGCQYFPRLTASKKDTDETKTEILGYIVVWDKICGPKKP